MLPISPEERAARLGNVAKILIDLARRYQAAEKGKDDNDHNKGATTKGVVTDDDKTKPPGWGKRQSSSYKYGGCLPTE